MKIRSLFQTPALARFLNWLFGWEKIEQPNGHERVGIDHRRRP